jgi:hypothetical protein
MSKLSNLVYSVLDADAFADEVVVFETDDNVFVGIPKKNIKKKSKF